VAEVMSIRSGS